MSYKKIEAAIDFLNAVPKRIFSATEKDENYKDDVAALRNFMGIMSKFDIGNSEEEQSAYWAMQSHSGGDGLLLKLTRLAESQDKKKAIEACRELGRMYLGKSRHGVEMPVSPEIAAGFFARAIRLGDEKSKEEYADIAESLGWFNSAALNLPEMKYEYDIRKTFNLHRVRMAEQFGGKLPELDEFGLIPENKTEKINELREALNTYKLKMVEQCQALKAKTQAFENKISDTVLQFGEMLDKKDKSLARAKKRGKRLRWLVAWLIILAMVPGLIMGPGEGIQGILYLLFLLPCTMNVLYYHNVSTFEEYMNAMPDVVDRASVFGATAAMVLIACFVLNILIFLFSSKKEDSFEEYKRELYEKSNLKEMVKEATRLVNGARSLSNIDIIRLKDMGVKHNQQMLDELTVMYHANLFCQNPLYTYLKLTNSSDRWKYSYKVPQWIYDAHEGIGNYRLAHSTATGESFAAEYFGLEYDEDGELTESFSDQTYEVNEDGELIPVLTEYYTEYEKSVGIECLLAGYLSGKGNWISGYPWRAKDMWAQFVSSNLHKFDIMHYTLRHYFANVADSAFLKASENGDKEATFLLAEAIYPAPRGLELAKEASRGEVTGAFDLYCKYDRYYNPPAPEEYDYEVSYDVGSSSSEPDPDPWGFKKWAAEAADKAIRRNNWEIGAAYSRGDIDADTYSKLMDQYGDPSKLGDPW